MKRGSGIAQGKGARLATSPEPIDPKKAVDFPGIGLAAAWPALHRETPSNAPELAGKDPRQSEGARQTPSHARADVQHKPVTSELSCDPEFLRQLAARVPDETERTMLLLLADFADAYDLGTSSVQDWQVKKGIA